MARVLTAGVASAVPVGVTGLAVPTAASAAPAAGGTAARRYTYVDLDVVAGVAAPPGRSSATGVNAAGEVAGTSSAPAGATGVAYIYRGGRMTGLGSIYTPYGAGSFASAINDTGVVVGSTHVSASEPPHAFTYQGGKMTDLGTGSRSGSASFATRACNRRRT